MKDFGEVILTACHILNRVPMRTNKETPYELWYKRKPNLSYLKVWVFVYEGGAISWSSKKQTCIADSTMSAEFIALALASSEAEWLRNLMFEIPFFPKPISPVAIHVD